MSDTEERSCGNVILSGDLSTPADATGGFLPRERRFSFFQPCPYNTTFAADVYKASRIPLLV